MPRGSPCCAPRLRKMLHRGMKSWVLPIQPNFPQCCDSSQCLSEFLTLPGLQPLLLRAPSKLSGLGGCVCLKTLVLDDAFADLGCLCTVLSPVPVPYPASSWEQSCFLGGVSETTGDAFKPSGWDLSSLHATSKNKQTKNSFAQQRKHRKLIVSHRTEIEPRIQAEELKYSKLEAGCMLRACPASLPKVLRTLQLLWSRWVLRIFL